MHTFISSAVLCNPLHARSVARRLDVHSNQIAQWKGQLLKGAAGAGYERHRTGDERPQDSAALGPRSLVRRRYAGGEALLLEGCAAIARSAFSIEKLPVVPSSKITP